MLELQDITKSFGGVEALRGSTFSVERQKITALIGPNGAGKTTLFDIISGLVAPDSGKVLFAGKAITRARPDQRANRGISRTFQQVRLFRQLTILDHFLMIEDNFDQYFWRAVWRRRAVNREKYREALSDYGIEREPEALVSELSYGQRKLLQLALAVLKPHTLLLLDEPVAGVNSVTQERIEGLLLKLKTKGETILLIDHDMKFVRRLSDHVICLDAGVVVVDGAPEQVLNDPRVLEAYLGV